ncbi:MAG: hypothetical protein ACP5J4_19055, partial [Anaerolineae bacterium]
DERFLLGVAQATPLWGDPCAVSPDFPYGHLPVYVARLFVMAAPGADPLFVMRLFSGLLGVLLVALAGAWGRALAGRRGPAGTWGALFAATLMAFAPFAIQQARFYTVDVLGAILASGAVLVATRRRWTLAGALTGLALACKASLAWCAVTVVVGYGLWEVHSQKSKAQGRKSKTDPANRRMSEFSIPHPASSIELRVTSSEKRVASNKRVFPRLPSTVYRLLSIPLAFALASPWALLRPVASWRGPAVQAMLASGRFIFPYTRQYAGTLPFLYPLAQMALWGLGPMTTLLGIVGVGWALRRWRRGSFALRLACLWTLIFFLMTAGLYVKFPRYLLPLYPVWAAWAALVCVKVIASPVARRVVATVTFVSTALLGWAQISIYAEPHPWIAASQWIYANVPHGAIVAVEEWDHALPVPLSEGDAGRYMSLTAPVYDEETTAKVAQLAEVAENAGVIVLASHRGYGALARQPEGYAATLAWYQDLLDEREVIAFGRCPRVGPLALTDDPLADAGLTSPLSLAERCGTPYALRLPHLDESFRVYDAPPVLLLVTGNQ